MTNNEDLPIQGRKVFLIATDLNMFPESFLETILANGFETYHVSADTLCPLSYKIEMIARLYPGSILLFYVDSTNDEIEWAPFVKDISQRYKDSQQFGVLYSKRNIESERIGLENTYSPMGLSCGITPLSYQRTANLQTIINLLAYYKANGRRKIVRAFCSPTSEVSFIVGSKTFKGPLKDVSLSHFSCVIEDDPDYISLEQHFQNMQLVVNGVRIRTNAQIVMQREMGGIKLSIFLFNKSNNTPGLNDDEYYKLSQKIYHIITDSVKDNLRNAFFKINRYKKAELPIETKVSKVMMELREEDEKAKKKRASL